MGELVEAIGVAVGLREDLHLVLGSLPTAFGLITFDGTWIYLGLRYLLYWERSHISYIK